MKLYLSTLLAGVLFGSGLAISGMTDPARVTGFLDVAGQWDMTLMFVMAAALIVTLPGFHLLQNWAAPWFAEQFYLPTRKDLDWKLILGSIVFGIGWGLSGFCPGPAIASLVSGTPEVLYFVVAMILGQNISRLFEKLISKPSGNQGIIG